MDHSLFFYFDKFRKKRMFLVEGWFDGGYKKICPGKGNKPCSAAGAAGALIKLNKVPVWSLSEYLGDDDDWACPDTSEMSAAIFLLRQITKHYARKDGRIIVRGDSLNVIRALRHLPAPEQLGTEAAQLLKLAEREIKKINIVCPVSFIWIGREYNTSADSLVRKAFRQSGL